MTHNIRSKFSIYVRLYAFTFAGFLAIDAGWLAYSNNNFYRPAIGHLMADEANLWAAGIFYLLYIAGIIYLAILPAKSKGDVWLKGGVLGLIAYGTYDMTNLAVMRDWPSYVTAIDMLWGSLLTAASARIGYSAKPVKI